MISNQKSSELAKLFRLNKLSQNYILDFDLKKQTFGRMQNGFIYKKDADFILVTCNTSYIRKAVQIIPPEKIILDFYVWDYDLMRFWERNKFMSVLKYAKNLGIDKCVQMDFSIFYGMPKPMLEAHLFKNFTRMEDAASLGFKQIYNFNCFVPDYIELYKEILPKEISMVIDQNHIKNKLALEQDLYTLRKISEFTKIKNAIILTTSQKTEKYSDLLRLLNRLNVTYIFLPGYYKTFAVLWQKGKV